jgi:hypothetical protein
MPDPAVDADRMMTGIDQVTAMILQGHGRTCAENGAESRDQQD